MAHPELHYVLASDSGGQKGRGETMLTLALGQTAPPLRFGADRPYVEAGRRYRFSLTGVALPAHASVTLLLDDDVLASSVVYEDVAESETFPLTPVGVSPFDDVMGLLTLEVRITLPRAMRSEMLETLEAEAEAEALAAEQAEQGNVSIQVIQADQVGQTDQTALSDPATAGVDAVPSDWSDKAETLETSDRVAPAEDASTISWGASSVTGIAGVTSGITSGVTSTASSLPYYQSLFSEPLELRIPEGPVARNLDGMAARVCRESALFLENTAKSSHASRAGGVERSLDIWETFLDQLEPLVERIRRHPKFRLTESERLDSPSRARSFTAKTARFIAEHPDELVPTAGAAGLTVPGAGALARGLTPRRILVESTGFSLDIPEHRMILAFLVRLERAAKNESTAIDSLLTKLSATLDPNTFNPSTGDGSLGTVAERNAPGTPQLRSTSSAVLVTVRSRIEGSALRARRMVDRIRKLARACAQALGLSVQEVLRVAGSSEGVLQPTRLFLTPGSYRQIFECMTAWHAPASALVEEQLLMEGTRRSRLYEQFVLIELISAVRGLGLALTEAKHVDYAGAGSLYVPVDHANVFTFVAPSNETANGSSIEASQASGLRLTLWYQPVISGGPHAGEAGIGLMRATRYSLSTTPGIDGATALNPMPSDTPYYTPDFLLCVESGVGRRWIILDAKYSSPRSVLLYKTPDLVYKYLFSIRAMSPQDHVEGLWLLCGNGVREKPALLSPLGGRPGDAWVQSPGLWVERCDATVAPENFIEDLKRIVKVTDVTGQSKAERVAKA